MASKLARDKLGQGIIKEVQVSIGAEVKKVPARVGLFGSTLAVFTAGDLAGKIGVRLWENQIISKLIKSGAKLVYTKENLIYQIFDGLFSTLRQTYWILDGNYGISFQFGEKKLLSEAMAALDNLNLFALGLRGGEFGNHKKIFQSKIKAILRQVGTQPRDMRKRVIKSELEKIKSMSDRELSVNVGAIRAKTTAARIKLQDLVDNIMSIEPRIIARRQTLVSVIDYIRAYLEGGERFLTMLLKEENWRRFVSSDIISHQKIQDQLIFYILGLKRIDMQPFALSCCITADELEQARDKIKAREHADAYKLLIKSRESLKRMTVRVDLEREIMRLTLYLLPQRQTKPFSWQMAIAKLREIHKRLREIDETNFVQPACQASLASLNRALSLLSMQNKENLTVAREYLKKAAGPLT